MAILVDPAAFYSPAETGPILGLAVGTLAKMRCLGQGAPYVKRGRTIWYRGADLLAVLDAGRVGSGAEFRERQRAKATNDPSR